MAGAVEQDTTDGTTPRDAITMGALPHERMIGAFPWVMIEGAAPHSRTIGARPAQRRNTACP